MAKLPALIETLDHIVHREPNPAAIRYAARMLREAGLFSAGAGGRGSPHMTNRDAVYLMLALVVAREPSQYVSTVEAVAGLERSSRPECPDGARPGFDAVCQAQTFGEALIVLLDNSDRLAILNPITHRLEKQPGDVTDRRVEATVWVTKTGGEFVGRILLQNLDGGASAFSADMQFGEQDETGEYRTWKGITSVQVFDPSPFIALKRTLSPTPPWVLKA